MSIQMNNVKAITLGGQSVKKIEKNGVVLWQQSGGSGDNGKWDFSNDKTNSIVSYAEYPMQFKSLINTSSNYISIANGQVLNANCKVSCNIVDPNIDPDLFYAYIGLDDGVQHSYYMYALSDIQTETTVRASDKFDLSNKSFLWCGSDIENVATVEYATTQYGVTLTYKDSSNNTLMTLTFSDIEWKIKPYTEMNITNVYITNKNDCGANENTYYTVRCQGSNSQDIMSDLTKNYAIRTRVEYETLNKFTYNNNYIYVGFDSANGKLAPTPVRFDRDATTILNASVANVPLRIGIIRNKLTYRGSETLLLPGTGETLEDISYGDGELGYFVRYEDLTMPEGWWRMLAIELTFSPFKILTWDKE